MGYSEQVKAAFIMQEQGIRRTGTIAGGADWDGTNFDIFTIIGGPIKVRSIGAHVTALCVGGLVPQLNFTPAGGGAASVICAAAAGVAWPVDTIVTFDGAVATPLAATAQLGHSLPDPVGAEGFLNGQVLYFVPGVISVINGVADLTAVLDWFMTFIPMTVDARVIVMP